MARSLHLQLRRPGRRHRTPLRLARIAVLCHPKEYRGLPGQLFHNNHNGTFTDVSAASGIARHIGKGMGVAFADYNGDGPTDIFVANDSVRSFLFRNKGAGKFEETGLETGVALRETATQSPAWAPTSATSTTTASPTSSSPASSTIPSSSSATRPRPAL